jgi:hypothetical protein
MSQIIISGILYSLWLLLPVMTFMALRHGRISPSMRVKGMRAAVVFALPAYAGLICLIAGLAWPPDIFFRQRNASDSVSVSGYHIVYAQQWGLDFYETYYEVTRADGLKAYLEIDGDDNKCWSITTQQTGTRIYFLCDEQTVTEHTSYVNTEQMLLYAGAISCSRPIVDLPFREYAGNPLISWTNSGDAELYCWTE